MNELIDIIGERISSEACTEVLSRFLALREEQMEPDPDEETPPQRYLVSESEGLQLLYSPTGRVTVLFLYDGTKEGFSRYAGSLPFGLSFDQTPNDVRKLLGQPSAEGGPAGLQVLGGYDFPSFSAHVSFRTGGTAIEMVTLMAPAQVPGRQDG